MTTTKDRPMTPTEAAREYVARCQAGQYDRVADLFAENAVFETPVGVVLRGREAIRAFYVEMLNRLQPEIRARSFVEQGRTCVLELEARMTPDGQGEWRPSPDGEFVAAAIDHMTFDADGRLAEMRVYLPPTSHWID